MARSLSAEDRQAVRNALIEPESRKAQVPRQRLERQTDGSYLNPNGVPNDDPVFKLLEEIEDQRHRDCGPPAPQMD